MKKSFESFSHLGLALLVSLVAWGTPAMAAGGGHEDFYIAYEDRQDPISDNDLNDVVLYVKAQWATGFCSGAYGRCSSDMTSTCNTSFDCADPTDPCVPRTCAKSATISITPVMAGAGDDLELRLYAYGLSADGYCELNWEPCLNDGECVASGGGTCITGEGSWSYTEHSNSALVNKKRGGVGSSARDILGNALSDPGFGENTPANAVKLYSSTSDMFLPTCTAYLINTGDGGPTCEGKSRIFSVYWTGVNKEIESSDLSKEITKMIVLHNKTQGTDSQRTEDEGQCTLSYNPCMSNTDCTGGAGDTCSFSQQLLVTNLKSQSYIPRENQSFYEAWALDAHTGTVGCIPGTSWSSACVNNVRTLVSDLTPAGPYVTGMITKHGCTHDSGPCSGGASKVTQVEPADYTGFFNAPAIHSCKYDLARKNLNCDYRICETALNPCSSDSDCSVGICSPTPSKWGFGDYNIYYESDSSVTPNTFHDLASGGKDADDINAERMFCDHIDCDFDVNPGGGGYYFCGKVNAPHCPAITGHGELVSQCSPATCDFGSCPNGNVCAVDGDCVASFCNDRTTACTSDADCP